MHPANAHRPWTRHRPEMLAFLPAPRAAGPETPSLAATSPRFKTRTPAHSPDGRFRSPLLADQRFEALEVAHQREPAHTVAAPPLRPGEPDFDPVPLDQHAVRQSRQRPCSASTGTGTRIPVLTGAVTRLTTLQAVAAAPPNQECSAFRGVLGPGGNVEPYRGHTTRPVG